MKHRLQSPCQAIGPIKLAIAILAVVAIIDSSTVDSSAQQTNSAADGKEVSPPPFRATAWLRIEDETPYIAYPPESEPELEVYRHTQAQLMLSPMVLRKAVDSSELKEKLAAAKIDDGVGWLRERLEIALLGNSELFTITVTDIDQDLACAAANAIEEAYFKVQAQGEAYQTRALIEQLDEERERCSTQITRLQRELKELDPADEKSRSTPARLQEELAQVEEIRLRIEERVYRLRVEVRAPARVTPLKEASPDGSHERPDGEDIFLADVEDEPYSGSGETIVVRADPIAPTNTLRALIEHDKRPWFTAESWVQMQARRPYVVFPSDDEPALDEFAATQIALVRSPLVLERVVAEPTIAKRLTAAGAVSPVKWIERRMVVERLGKSEYFRIAAFTTDPQLSADLANAIIKEYLRVQTQDEGYRFQRVLELLEEEKSRKQSAIQVFRHELVEMKKSFEDYEQRPDVLLRRKELARQVDTYRLISDRVARMRLEARAPARVTLAFAAELPSTPFELLPKLDDVSTNLSPTQPAPEPSATISNSETSYAASSEAAPIAPQQSPQSRPQAMHPLLAAGIGFVAALAAVWLLRSQRRVNP